ncbi:MAG: flap endonuclease-1 [Nanobdellota archaeon]
MGTNLASLLVSKETSMEELRGKTLVVDGYNILYQFLSSLRMRDGTPLQDSKGNITSHLNGLFLRSVRIMSYGIKLVFVFDGKHPELKRKEVERRKELKEKAKEEYNKAAEKEDIEGMKKYSSRISSLTKDMVEEAKELLDGLGIPWVQAPTEGEAQAAHMVKKGDCDMVVSQDTDALLFGASHVVRNLTISQKKKKQNKLSYDNIKPQLFDLSENLNELGVDQDHLIALSMLVGTDFNQGGVKGIGPKKGLKIVKNNKDNIEGIFKEAGWNGEVTWQEVFYLFKNMPVTDDYSLDWKKADPEKVKKILCERHEFSTERVGKDLDRIIEKKKPQKGLGEFF